MQWNSNELACTVWTEVSEMKSVVFIRITESDYTGCALCFKITVMQSDVIRLLVLSVLHYWFRFVAPMNISQETLLEYFSTVFSLHQNCSPNLRSFGIFLFNWTVSYSVLGLGCKAHKAQTFSDQKTCVPPACSKPILFLPIYCPYSCAVPFLHLRDPSGIDTSYRAFSFITQHLFHHGVIHLGGQVWRSDTYEQFQ